MNRRAGLAVGLVLGAAAAAGVGMYAARPSAQALHDRGLAEQRTLRYDAARRHFEQALELRRRAVGTDHPDTWTTLRALAGLERTARNYQREVVLRLELAASFERAHGPRHPELAEALIALGRAQGNAGELEAAERSFRSAGSIFRQAPDPQRSMTRMHANLSWIAELRGQSSLAEAGYRRVLTWWERYVGDEHPQTAWTLQHLAEVVARQGRSAQAETFLRRALAARLKLEGPRSGGVADVLHGLGRILADQGRRDEAAVLFEEALAIRLEVRPEDHPDVRSTREALAGLSDLL